MSRMMRQMTAALVLPRAMAFETMARTTALWARRMADILRPPAVAPAPVALPTIRSETMQLAAPAPEAPSTKRGDGDGDDMEAAREVLSDADPDPAPDAPATAATGAGRAEETGGSVQDTAALVDLATDQSGKRPEPNGTVA